MTEAETAYAAAERKIEKARREGATVLSFDREELLTLDALPPEIDGLDALHVLYLDNTQVANIAPLAGLGALQELRLENTQVADIAPLAGLGALQELRLNNTQVADIAPLAGLGALQALYLHNTQVADIAPLAGLGALRTLYLHNTQVANIAPLASLGALQALNLSNTQVADIAPLASLGALQALGLDNTQVADIAPLAGLGALHGLYLDNTQVADIAPLAGLEALQALNLSNTQVADLRAVRGLDGLREGAKLFGGLSFSGTPAVRVDPAGLGRLAEIEDDEERTNRTLDYLNELDEWPPAPPEGPGQDEILTVAVGEDGVEVDLAAPDAAEQADEVKRACHHRLREAVAELERSTSNTHPRIGRRAQMLRERLAAPLAEVDLLEVHLDLESLRGVYEARAARAGEDAFGADQEDALRDVLTIGPGLTLDNEKVEAFEARARRAAGEVVAEELRAAEQAVARGIVAAVELMGPTIRSHAEHGEAAPEGSAGAETRRVLAKNTPIALGRYVLDRMATPVIGAVGLAGAGWLFGLAEPLLIIAQAQGPGYASWLAFVLETMRQNAARLALAPDAARRLGEAFLKLKA